MRCTCSSGGKSGVWFPTVFPDRCDGCEGREAPRCIKFCPNKVFELRGGKAIVTHPYQCVYRCTACEPICPKKAISFPMRETAFTTAKPKDKGLLHKVTCVKCRKVFLTNMDVDTCMDCESKI